MTHRWKRAAAVLGTAGLLAIAPLSAATASAVGANTQGMASTTATLSKQVGVVTQHTVGVPRSLRLRHTISAHTWYRQNSKDILVSGSFDLQIWSYATARTTGVSVSWFNPLTHRWQKADHSGNDFILDLTTAQPRLQVAPNTWARIDFRITFAANTKPGTWYIRPAVPYWYSLLNSKGVPQPDYLGQGDEQFRVRVHR